MADMIAVKPVEGRTVPFEKQVAGTSRRDITRPCMVETSAYYRRRIAHGDLEAISAEDVKAAQAKLEADEAAAQAVPAVTPEPAPEAPVRASKSSKSTPAAEGSAQ